MKKSKIILIVISVAAAIFLLLELISSLVLAKIYNRDFDFSLVQKQKYFETNGLKANISATVWGEKFTTDNFSSRPKKELKKTQKRVFIGDSVLEGIGLPDSLIFTELLRSNDFDILNLSMPGNSSFDYQNIVKAITDSTHLEFISDIHEIKIVHCLNDIYGKSNSKELPEMSKTFLAKINAALSGSSAYKLIKMSVYQHSDSYFRYDEAFYHNNEKLNETIGYYQTVDSICRSKNINLTFYILPYKSQLTSKNYYPNNQLSAAFSKSGISFFDISDSLIAGGNPSDMYLFADEIHFSASGHKAIAEILSKVR